jgi:hypothetical protein
VIHSLPDAAIRAVAKLLDDFVSAPSAVVSGRILSENTCLRFSEDAENNIWRGNDARKPLRTGRVYLRAK